MLIPLAIALTFFYAPVDEDGLNQKIFYFHVPIALTAYACFGWGAWKGLQHLWKGKPGADLGICAVGTVLAAMAVAGRARELLLPLLFLPLAIPIVVGGVGASVVEEPARYLGFLALYDAVFAIISWASFEYVVTE